MKKYWTVFLTILIVLTLAFIFTNSMENVEKSQQRSGAVTEWVSAVLEIVAGKGNVTDHFIRKLAHFIEFFALGLELSALCFLHDSPSRSLYFPVTFPLFFGLIAALTDETIQVVSVRGSQVLDVWLDFSGVLAGTGTVLTVWLIRRKRQKRKGG